MQFLQKGGWLYLIPGFVALFVAGFISDFPIVRDSQLPIVYVVLTLLSAIMPLGLVHLYGVAVLKPIDLFSLTKNPWFYSTILLCSVGWGLVFGIFYTNDAVSTLLRKSLGESTISIVSHSELLRELLSRSPNREEGRSPNREEGWRVWDGRQGRNSSGAQIRHNDNLTLIVEFKGETRKFEGKVDKWFAGETPAQVYLSPACGYDSSGVVSPIPGPGIWLNLKDALSIGFIDTACSECAWAHDKIQNTGAFDSDLNLVVTPVCNYSDIAERLAPAPETIVPMDQTPGMH